MKVKSLKIIVIALLTVLTLSAQVNAQKTYEFWGGRWMYPPKLDGYIPSWMAGGGLTYLFVSRTPELFGAKPMNPKVRLALSIGLIYLYEINKDAYRNTCPIPGVSWGIDPRGADILGDPVWASIGAVGAMVAEQAIKRDRERKFRLMMTPDKSQIFLIEVRLDML